MSSMSSLSFTYGLFSSVTSSFQLRTQNLSRMLKEFVCVMANFIYPLNWVPGYPCIQSSIILGVPVRAFLEKMNT